MFWGKIVLVRTHLGLFLIFFSKTFCHAGQSILRITESRDWFLTKCHKADFLKEEFAKLVCKLVLKTGPRSQDSFVATICMLADSV
jgi:hypothetical protein